MGSTWFVSPVGLGPASCVSTGLGIPPHTARLSDGVGPAWTHSHDGAQAAGKFRSAPACSPAWGVLGSSRPSRKGLLVQVPGLWLPLSLHLEHPPSFQLCLDARFPLCTWLGAGLPAYTDSFSIMSPRGECQVTTSCWPLRAVWPSTSSYKECFTQSCTGV